MALHRSSLDTGPPADVRQGFRGVTARGPMTSFGGRDRELASIRQLLRDPSVRLLTLTGAGGVGKTRLAIHVTDTVVDDFPGGVWFVPLASVREPALVTSAIAQTLNVQERRRRTSFDGITERVSGSPSLLILDNFEHLVEAAPLLVDLLAACPSLTSLVTSRVLLRLTGEHAFPVPPLALPPATTDVTVENIARSPAVQLFVARARAVRPDVTLTDANAAAVEAICRRLDGVPLALELAAARARHVTLDELRARLEAPAYGALGVLKGGPRDAPVRQRTMRNATAWSYGLLSDAEQRILRQCAVFVGGFTRDAAMAVVRGDDLNDLDVEAGLDALVDQSLLRADLASDGSSRYAILEPVREFGLEQLTAQGEVHDARRRHSAWCVERVTLRWDQLLDEEIPPNAWLEWADAEQDNVRAALAWCLHAGEAESAMWLAGAFHWFWEYRGLFREGVRWLEQALASEGDTPPLARAWALEGKGVLRGLQGDWDVGIRCLEQSLALDREIDDRRGVARALLHLGIRLIDNGDYDSAVPLLEESETLYQSLGSTWGQALARAHRGSAHYGNRDLSTAADLLRGSWELALQANDPLARFVAPLFLGLVACEQRQPAEAARWFREVLDFYGAAGGFVTAWHRDPDGAARTVAGVALLAGLIDRPAQSACLLGAATRPQEEIGLAFALPEQAAFNRLDVETRARLGDTRFEATWTDGYRTAPAEIVEEVEVILAAAAAMGATSGAPGTAWGSTLTEREREVLGLIAAGRTDREIGTMLFISHRTVNKHVGSILAKLDVTSRTEAVSYALLHGLA
jgi:predicted ATPase/DNA-binding CsgD family transcriptional regulator